MEYKHLTDEDFQDYLDGNLKGKTEAFEGHLVWCEICRGNLMAYRNLYSGLGQECEVNLSSDFADSVIAKLAAEPVLKPWFNFLHIFLAAVGIIAVIGFTQHYYDWGSLGVQMVDSFIPKIDLQPPEVTAVVDTAFDSLEKYKLLIFSLIVLLAIIVMDQLFFKKKSMFRGMRVLL